MNRNRFAFGLLVALASLALFHPGGAAAQPVPLGPETRVDTLEGKHPNEPWLAAQPGGDFEVAWAYLGTQPPFVAARHFAADGTPTQAAQISLGGPGTFPNLTSVTATPGGFEVVWNLSAPREQSYYRRHLDLNGVPDPGTPVRLVKYRYITPWVWQVRGHGFLGGWPVVKGTTIIGAGVQRLSPTGQRTGPVLRLNSRTAYINRQPTLTAVADGGFLAVWEGTLYRSGTYTSLLRARLFSRAGKPLGPDFDVSGIAPGIGDHLFASKVAAAPGGGFAVAWRFYDELAHTVTHYLRFFDDAGRPRGPEIPGPGGEWIESMAFDDAGNLLALWSNDVDLFVPDLKVQLFGPDGAPLGPEARVASEASGPFTRPFRGNVAWAGGSWVVAWLAQTEEAHEGPNAIFVRRFAGEE